LGDDGKLFLIVKDEEYIFVYGWCFFEIDAGDGINEIEVCGWCILCRIAELTSHVIKIKITRVRCPR